LVLLLFCIIYQGIFFSRTGEFFQKDISLIKERANFVTEFWDLADYFFEAPTSYDEKAAKNWKEETLGLMQQVISELNKIEDFTSVNIETLLKEWMTANEIGMGKVMQPLRLSLVGALKGPHLFDIIEMIGKEEISSFIEVMFFLVCFARFVN
jgi:glutamyl-tRNA synthetase